MSENKAKNKASVYKNKYNASHYDSLRIVVPKGTKEIIREYAESKGESINGFVNRAINETMERDNK